MALGLWPLLRFAVLAGVGALAVHAPARSGHRVDGVLGAGRPAGSAGVPDAPRAVAKPLPDGHHEPASAAHASHAGAAAAGLAGAPRLRHRHGRVLRGFLDPSARSGGAQPGVAAPARWGAAPAAGGRTVVCRQERFLRQHLPVAAAAGCAGAGSRGQGGKQPLLAVRGMQRELPRPQAGDGIPRRPACGGGPRGPLQEDLRRGSARLRARAAHTADHLSGHRGG